VLVLLTLVVTACSPSVPDLVSPSSDAAGAVPAAVPAAVANGSPATESAAIPASQALSTIAAPTTSTPAPSTTIATTTTTAAPSTDHSPETSVGSWTLTRRTYEERGTGFTATIATPVLSGDVDAALLGRVSAGIDGRVESQIGGTLALWQSIEARGSPDISGSTLRLDFDVAGFEDDFISLRFFSDERVGESGGVIRRATTLMLDLASGATVGLDEIIGEGESRAALLELVRAGLLEDHFAGDIDAFSLWAGDLEARDIDQVVLTPDGLDVWFDELEVGPPQIGVPVVSISYADLEGILDPAWPATAFTR